MALRDQLLTDYLAFDNLQPVMLISVSNAGNTTWDMANALPRAVTFKDTVAGQGMPYAVDQVFHLFVNEFPAGCPVPKMRDIIVDAAGVYHTISGPVELQTLGTRYRCPTTNLQVSAALADLVSISRPVQGDDSSGGRLPSAYTAIASAVPARIQPTGKERDTRMGKLQLAQKFAIHMSSQVYPEAFDLITELTGAARTFQVLSATSMDRLDLMIEIDAEIVR